MRAPPPAPAPAVSAMAPLKPAAPRPGTASLEEVRRSRSRLRSLVDPFQQGVLGCFCRGAVVGMATRYSG
eukprot:11179324-Lingulodinium_polyedra.AAC.1